MAEKIKIEDLSGLKKVHEIMVTLALPNINAEALKTVGKLEGLEFKKALVSIANNEDGMNHNKVYVHSITSLLTSPVQAMLASMGYINLPNESLIKIGKACGREFRTHLSGAASGNKDSIDWIQRKITEYGSTAPLKSAENKPQAQQVNNAQNQSKPTNVSNIKQQSNRREEPDFSHGNNPYPNAQKNKPTAAAESTQPQDREFFCMTFYGNKSALCFNAVSKENEHTLTLDAGNKKPNQPDGGRAIDWQDKVTFGFSADELFEFAWVLLGVSDACEFSGHGPMHDKKFQFQRQDKGYFSSLSAKDKGARAIPLSFAAGARLMFLVTRQIHKNFPHMTVNEIIMMLKTMAKPKLQSAPAPRARAANE